MNEEYLYEIGQQVYILYTEPKSVKAGKVLECRITIDAIERTVIYTLLSGNKTVKVDEAVIFPSVEDALLALAGVM